MQISALQEKCNIVTEFNWAKANHEGSVYQAYCMNVIWAFQTIEWIGPLSNTKPGPTMNEKQSVKLQ